MNNKKEVMSFLDMASLQFANGVMNSYIIL